MKKHSILIYKFYLFICCNCQASVYDFSIRSFAEKKVLVVKRIDSRGLAIRGRESSNYIPEVIHDYYRLNKKEIKKLVFDNERYIWNIKGKIIMSDGLEGDNVNCIVASIPIKYSLEGEISLDVVKDVAFIVDYAFCDPKGDRDWLVSGNDSGLGLMPEKLWFKDVKIDVPQYMQRVKIYNAAEEKDLSTILMEDLKKWSDIRGLAVLERLLELPSINTEEIITVINSKGSEFQLYSMSIVISSKLPQKTKWQFADS